MQRRHMIIPLLVLTLPTVAKVIMIIIAHTNGHGYFLPRVYRRLAGKNKGNGETPFLCRTLDSIAVLKVKNEVKCVAYERR